MSSPGTESKPRVDQAVEQTGDYAKQNTSSGVAANSTDGKPDPLLSLLRPPQNDGELGRLAHFAVTRLLGQGGMGAVFESDDLLLHRKVAVKVMRPELTARPEARERFLREARTAGGLEHDHIIAVHEVAEDNGVWFIVMPLLKGEGLDVRLAREGRLSIHAVLKLGRETAEGLATAHAQGLVHRDIKPANLWLEGKGEEAGFRRVKILDFGLARAVQDDQHLTAAGGLLGTPAYMAPEQADGQEMDGRTDLFSLGAVLYRCCTGELPFSGKTSMATLSALANKTPVPVNEKNPAVPSALADLIMQLLAKKPEDRPQSAAEVAESLRRIEQEHAAVTLQALPAPRRRRLSALTVCLLTLLGLGVAAIAGVIVVKVRTPDGKETAVTAPTGSNVNVDAKGEVIVTLPVDAPAVPVEPTLKTINHKPAAEFLKAIDAAAKPPSDDAWLKQVAALPADKQVEAVAAKLKELNPGFDGKVTPTIENGVVVGLEFHSGEVTDLSPVRALAGLRMLDCHGVNGQRGRLTDLSPLKDMKLTELDCQNTRVSDLSMLKDMKLMVLDCGDTKVSDLSPLKDMPLMSLSCYGTPVSDLSPMKGMPLTGLNCYDTKVFDLSPLKDMKLTFLNCWNTPVSDLSPLKDMKLTQMYCGRTQVSDLSILKGMPLIVLGCDFQPERDAELLHSITTLEKINDKPAAEFWKAYQTAEKPKPGG